MLVHELYRDVAAHGEVGDLGDPLVLAMQVGEAEQPGRILLAWILHRTKYWIPLKEHDFKEFKILKIFKILTLTKFLLTPSTTCSLSKIISEISSITFTQQRLPCSTSDKGWVRLSMKSGEKTKTTGPLFRPLQVLFYIGRVPKKWIVNMRSFPGILMIVDSTSRGYNGGKVLEECSRVVFLW